MCLESRHRAETITGRLGAHDIEHLDRPDHVEKLRWRRQMAVEEFTYLRGRTSRTVKVTLLSAQQAAAYYDPEKSRGAYATRDAYLADHVDFTRRRSSWISRRVRIGSRRKTSGSRPPLKSNPASRDR